MSDSCVKLAAVSNSLADPPLGRALLHAVTGHHANEPLLTFSTEIPQRAATFGQWPSWVPEELRMALNSTGVSQPWAHQVKTAELAWQGKHVVLATGTASGKSLAYQLPVLAKLLSDPRSTALYLAPTKALGADQVRAVRALGLADVHPITFDGDTPISERDVLRTQARWVFTNPDMVHCGMLPTHARWAKFFRRLTFIVVDECHVYRGVFGSHVALLLRRLRRVAARYGADPVFVFASATVAEAAAFTSTLCGLPCVAVLEDGSPSGERTVALCEPPLLPQLDIASESKDQQLVRKSSTTTAAGLLADLVIAGARTLVFARSRLGAEVIALEARRILARVDKKLAKSVAAYRAGFLPEERRALEQSLISGELLGVATTNALELGVNISGLDAVVIVGYPGTLGSFWQQAGRAGRGDKGALVLFIAQDDPLDTYLAHHPAALLDKPVESTILDPLNPHILGPQLACAAAELPLTDKEIADFGDNIARAVVDELVDDGALRQRATGWYWRSRDNPQRMVDIRSSGGEPVCVVEKDSGRLLGTVDAVSACRVVHQGAIHLHQGESYVVDELDLAAGLALVHQENPDWVTQPKTTVDISVLHTTQRRRFPEGVTVCLGQVRVTSQVTGYLRKLATGKILDRIVLDLPAENLVTMAVWYTISDELLGSAPGGAGLDPARIPGALHAAEHAAISLLPLFATCDRWDIGGVSTALHADTGEATVFVHDGHPGGVGFADRGFTALVPWLAATQQAICCCSCSAGCPSCVQSPKCGSGNEPLDKAGAIAVLNSVLGVIGSFGVNPSEIRHSADPSSGSVAVVDAPSTVLGS